MAEPMFSAASLLAIAGWVMLAIGAVQAEGRSRSRWLWAGGRLVPLCLAGLYMLSLALHWGPVPGAGFGSLAGTAAWFAVPGKMLVGWLHFLAFDLLVGAWMVADAQAPGRRRWLLLPALPLAFLYGPLGLLVHLSTQHLIARIARPRVQNG